MGLFDKFRSKKWVCTECGKKYTSNPEKCTSCGHTILQQA